MYGDFLGSFCNCLLPENIQVSAVGHVPERLTFAGKIQTLKISANLFTILHVLFSVIFIGYPRKTISYTNGLLEYDKPVMFCINKNTMHTDKKS